MSQSPSSVGGKVFVASQCKARVCLRVEELKKAIAELLSSQKNLPADQRCDARLESLVRDLHVAADALCEFLTETQ